MSADIANPIPLPPNRRTNADPRIELDAHLKVTFKDRLWDGKASGSRNLALETRDHCFVITLLGRFGLGGCGLDGRAVDGFVKDGVVRVVLFHRCKVVRALKEVLALAGCIFRPDGLAVDALGRETLVGREKGFSPKCTISGDCSSRANLVALLGSEFNVFGYISFQVKSWWKYCLVPYKQSEHHPVGSQKAWRRHHDGPYISDPPHHSRDQLQLY